MEKRLPGAVGALVVSLVLLVGPLAGTASPHIVIGGGGGGNPVGGQYPPQAVRCRVSVDVDTRFTPPRIRIAVRCRFPGGERSVMDIVLRSQPVRIGSFTTDENGDLDATVTLPDGVEEGQHHLEVWAGNTPVAVMERPDVPVATGGHNHDDHGMMTTPLLERIPLTVRGDGPDRQVLIGSAASAGAGTATTHNSSGPVLMGAAVTLVIMAGITAVAVARRRRSGRAPT